MEAVIETITDSYLKCLHSISDFKIKFHPLAHAGVSTPLFTAQPPGSKMQIHQLNRPPNVSRTHRDRLGIRPQATLQTF